jgi:NADH-quinone oxidoreductase subunit L
MTLMAVLDGAKLQRHVYTWMTVGTMKMEVGFQIDALSAMMMCVVTSCR